MQVHDSISYIHLVAVLEHKVRNADPCLCLQRVKRSQRKSHIYHFLGPCFGGGGKYISACGCDISSAFAAAFSNPGLKGLRGISGLLSACENVGDFGTFGLLKCFLNGNSEMPPRRLNANVRGVAGVSWLCACGIRGMPGVKGVAGSMSYSSFFMGSLSRWPYLSS